MKAREAIEALQRLATTGRGECDFLVQVQSQGGLGGTSAVGVAGIHAGFDWDAGRVLIRTEQPVIALTAEEVQAIVQSVRTGQSWHAYQVHKHLRERIKELEQRVRDLEVAR